MHISYEQLENIYRLAPEIVLCATGILIMLIDPFTPPARKRLMGWLGFVGTLGALAGLVVSSRHPGAAYSRLVVVDGFSLFMHAIVIVVAALVILGSFRYLDDERVQRGEYYALILFAVTGMCILSGANELVTAFLGLEMSSIATYILAGFRRTSMKSNEASLKYFLLGSFATAFFLYGIAMVYGATGQTGIPAIANVLATASPSSLLVLGVGMIFVGLGFKVVIAPFQVYAPDVYEGAPTPVTGLLASAPKAATFALMLRIFYTSFSTVGPQWFWAVWIAAVLSMVVGNFAALTQTNVKRMLAYSSVAHAGYIMVAFAASTAVGMAAVMFYIAAYVLMKLGAFLVVTELGGTGEKRLEIKDYAGLGTQQPVLAACFALFLLSLLGLPLTGGFVGKFYAFQAGLDSRLVWLVVIAALNTIVGAYYYLHVIVVMYFNDPQTEFPPQKTGAELKLALLACAIGVIYLGIFPSRVMHFAYTSAQALLSR
jgi:NADH-quinone oxidoreductase subunit N